LIPRWLADDSRRRQGGRGSAAERRAPGVGGGAWSPLVDLHDASPNAFRLDRVVSGLPHMLDSTRSVLDAWIGQICR
jgi:hypothetical protein